MRYFFTARKHQFFLNWQISWHFFIENNLFFFKWWTFNQSLLPNDRSLIIDMMSAWAKWWKGHYIMMKTRARVRSIVGDILTPKRIFSSVTGNIRIIIDIHAPKEGHYTSVVSHSRLKWFQIIRYEMLVRCWSRNSVGCYGEVRIPSPKKTLVLRKFFRADLRAHKYRWASESRPNNVDRIKKPNDT